MIKTLVGVAVAKSLLDSGKKEPERLKPGSWKTAWKAMLAPHKRWKAEAAARAEAEAPAEKEADKRQRSLWKEEA